jgi:hypothetical protein
MSVTPSGLPAWTRTADHSQYGGHVDKRDYGGVGAINAMTDVSAAQFVRMCSDVAAVARTAPMWVITYECNDAGAAPPTIEIALGMTGTRLTSYEGDDPPTGFPSASRVTDGAVTFTFAASYDDEYGVEGEYAPMAAFGSAEGTSHRDVATTIAGSTVTVRVFDDTGAAVADPRVCLEVI